MSGKAFEGLEKALAGRDPPEDYVPGEAGFLFSHVERLIEEFLSGSITEVGEYHYGRVNTSLRGKASQQLSASHREGFLRENAEQPVVKMRAEYLSRFLPEGEFDANTFLDAVIGELADRGYHDRFGTILGELELDLSDLLDPLVQALYSRGHNNFVLDLSPLIDEKHSVKTLAYGLKGSQENPLGLVCKGEVAFFGNYVSDCRLRLDGDMECSPSFGGAGRGAFRSAISVEGRLAPSTGTGADQCTFTFYSLSHPCRIYKGLNDSISTVEKILEQAGSMIDHCQTYHCDVLYASVASAWHCAYHVKMPPDEKDLASLKAAGFFKAPLFGKRKNSLYVPDGTGDWKEVKP